MAFEATPSLVPGPAADFLPGAALPKGGLAAHGLGERFGVRAHTGGCSLSIPFAASRGRGASQAEVVLGYQSGGGRSAFGWGWDVAVPGIGRRAAPHLPTYTDADTFCLAGAEDLVPLLVPAGGGGWQPYDQPAVIDGAPHRVERFRPRTDDSRTRIERCTETGTGNVFWRTVDAGNVTRIFGRSAGARISDPADPAGRLRVYRWLLEEVRDDRGNVAVYEYKREDTAGVAGQPGEQHRLAPGAPPQANRYLKRIRYANAVPGDPASTRMSVVFDYGEHELGADEAHPWPARPDAYSDHHAGYEVRTWRLCRRLMMFHDFGADLGDGPLPRLVRTLELTHDSDPTSTRLTAVTHVGYRWNGASYDTAALPPLELTYSAAQPATAVADLALADVPAGARLQFVDLDGDGLPGVLSAAAGGWTYQRPLGGGGYAPPVPVPQLPPTGGVDGAAGLRDIDGTQRLASVAEPSGPGGSAAVPVGSALRRPDGGWEPMRPFLTGPGQDLADPGLDRLDVDGDGLPDLLRRGPDELAWTASAGRDGYGPTRRVPTAATEAAGPRPPAADARHEWFTADMTGDGLTDLVRVRNGSVEYWPNLGWGRFGARVTMGNLGPLDSAGARQMDLGEHFDPRRVRLADTDGTGTADLLYLGDQHIVRCVNRSGTSWADPEVLAPAPPVGALDELRVLDLLGAGTPCLVWTTSAPAGPRARYLDLCAAGRPLQLRGFANNLGAQTDIAYASSAQLQLADRRAGTPWRSRLAGPVQVVTEVRTTDAVAQASTVTAYRYRDGWFDPAEREFRGFARVETTDAETLAPGGNELDLPPVRTVEWFHRGGPDAEPDGIFAGDPAALALDGHDLAGVTGPTEYRQAVRALAGQLQRSELYADDGLTGNPVTATATRMRVRQLQPAWAGRPAAFRVEPLESLTAHYERTADDPRVTHVLTLATDSYGAATSIATIGYPRRLPEVKEQEQVLAGWSVADLTSTDDPDTHRISVPTATWEYEVTGLAVPPAGRFTPPGLATTLALLPERDYGEPATPGLAQRRLVSANRTEFWDDALAAALPAGQLGRRALARRQLTFALTPQLVADVFGGEVTPALLSGDGGYELAGGRWWASGGVRGYDAAGCYLPVSLTSPAGNTASVDYDAHHLLVTAVRASGTAPLSLNATTVAPDYVTLAPWALTDPHAVQHSVAFDPLGRVTAEWSIALDGTGDTVPLPHTLHSYGSGSWAAGTGPAWSHTARRERHGESASPWQQQRLYVDGLGRVAMTKVQAEPGEALADDGAGGTVLVDTTPDPRWVGTGRTVFNNKGLPVEQYEPYFAADSGYDSADALVKRAVSQVRRYDPLGRLVRVDYPDGTFATSEVGPWSQTDADRNDTVLASDWFAARTGLGVPPAEARAAALAAGHANTPAVALCDPFGRVVRIRADNGPDGVYETRLHLDSTGAVVAVDDARGVRAAEQLNDAAGRTLRTRSPDAGEQRSLADAAGRQLRHWTAAGHRVSVRYDLLGRPTELAVRQPGGAADTLLEYTVYGEQHPQASARYLVGQVHRRYDAVGLSVADRYDLAGNLVAGSRRLLADPGSADWAALVGQPLAALDGLTAGVLDAEAFSASTAFDALRRPVTQTQPDGTEVTLGYNGGGLLDTVSARLGGGAAVTTFVTGIGYDAHRRRTSVGYGNGVAGRMDYDPLSQQLTGLSTRLGPTVLQDLAYIYDPVGNVVQTDDGAAQAVFFAGAVVAPGGRYSYDPIYRLRTATGREHASLGVQPDAADPALPPLPHPNDANALRSYTETYSYDEVGNITAFAHASPTSSWTRNYAYPAGSNRLTAHSLPGDPVAGPFSAVFGHDPGGNVTSMPGLTALAWDHAGKLAGADLGGGGTVGFHYDGAGNRVRKVWQRLGGLREERVYLGDYEIFRRYRNGALVFERRTLHVSDGSRRAALAETVTVDADHPGFDGTPRLRYQLGDKLGSSALECDETGAVISYEEYHPFGTTALWLARGAAAVSTKRHRYTGKEKDEETGLYSFGARYYACWLGRWLSPDIAGLADGVNRYCYVRNNPLRMTDPTGLVGEEDAQMWFSEARAMWARCRATAKGRGFTDALKDYLDKVHDLWGGPAEWDIGHKGKPFAMLEPGEESSVGVENRGWNRSEGASKVKEAVGEARAEGQTVRDAEGAWPGAKLGKRYKQPAPPTEPVQGIRPTGSGGTGSTPGGSASGGTGGPTGGTGAAEPPPVAPKPGAGAAAEAAPAEQLNLNFDKPADPVAAKPADPAAVANPADPAAAKPVEPVKPAEPPATGGATAVENPPPVKQAAAGAEDAAAAAKPGSAVAQDAATAGKVGEDVNVAAAVSKDVTAATEVAKDANALANDAKAVQVATKEAAAVTDLAKDAKAVGDALKTAAPLAKDAAAVTKEAGALTKMVNAGSKVVKIAAPVVKVAAPVVKTIGKVAKPLGVGVAAYELGTAHNNTDRLVASGDLIAGAAMYAGPVGEAFSVSYTVTGLADKGIEKASVALVGVDLSPSNGVAHTMDAVDKVASYVLPDDKNQPAYKNENKIAWFLIDKLGF